MKNYYEILGIESRASQIDIKKAYFGLVRKYPPDHFPEEFMEIREAYEVLSNEKTRREYDEEIILSPVIRVAFEHSRQAFMEGDYELAIQGLEEIVKRVPESSMVKSLLGQAYIENGNSVKAIRVFEDLVREYPENPAFMGHLAKAYLDRGWHKRGREAFERATQLDGDNISFWMGWAETCRMGGDYDAQRDILERATEIAKENDSDSIALYMELIQSDIQLEDLEAMEKHLDLLTDLAKDREDIREHIGYVFARVAAMLNRMGHRDMAQSMVDHAIELLPEDEDIKDLKRTLDRFADLDESILEFMEDEDIHEGIIELICVQVIPGYVDEDDVPVEIAKAICELDIAEDLRQYLPSINLLRERYPDVYDLKKEFFETLKIPSKRRSLIKKRRRELFRFGQTLEAHGGLEEDDWEFDLYEPQQPYVREQPKVGRNDPCPCGSGKKYKKCCGR